MKKYFSFILPCVLCVACAGTADIKQQRADVKIDFPENFRQWTHVKTAINGPHMVGYSGFHHVYANAKAMEGYKTGNFPDGAMMAFEVVESLEQKNGDVLEGKRKLVDVMMKFANGNQTTGGWMFEGFRGSGAEWKGSLTDPKKQCFDCHASQHARDFVFSAYRQ
jgi:hypothetical protein